MSVFDYTKAFIETTSYSILPRKAQIKFQKKKLKDIIKYAKNNSEYYSRIIPDSLDYEQIEPINKIEFLKNFNDIVTDRTITKERVLGGINNANGLRLNNKYSVAITSGSTGNPAVLVQDDYFQKITSVAGFFRIFKGKFPIITISQAGAYGIESSIIKENMSKLKNLDRYVIQLDAEAPIDTIIDRLENIGPGTIIGYTGVIDIIANKLSSRGKKIKENRIFLSAEKCTEFDKEIIQRGFDCKDIRSAYGCTEAGQIACECKCGHLHIMSDLVKIEPVDSNNKKVDYGVKSDKILITNLNNKVQPIIRYEVTDSVVLHKGETCECGCKEDWLEIEGRSKDNLTFDNNGEIIEVPSISLIIAMSTINKKGLSKFNNYQIIAHRNKQVDIRLDYLNDVNHTKVNTELEKALNDFFSKYGLSNMKYTFSEGEPLETSRGKRKRVSMAKEDNE